MFARRPDLVICMTDPPFIGAMARVVAARFRAPVLVIAQDVFPEIAVKLGRLHNPVVVHSLRLLVNSSLRSADRVVAIGDTMKRRLEEKGVRPDRIRVIPNWVDVDPRPAGAARQPLGAGASADQAVRGHALRQRRLRAGPRHADQGVHVPPRHQRPRRADHRRRRPPRGADPARAAASRRTRCGSCPGSRTSCARCRSRPPTSTSSASPAGSPATSSPAASTASSPPGGR